MSLAIGSGNVVGLDTVQVLDAAKVAACDFVWLQATEQDVRMTIDGTNPSAFYGVRLTAGDPPLRLDSQAAEHARFIGENIGANLHVVYFVEGE